LEGEQALLSDVYHRPGQYFVLALFPHAARPAWFQCLASRHERRYATRLTTLGGGAMTDQQGYFIEDLTVGMAEEVSNVVTEAMIEQFAAVSGDDNPIHLDEAYAASTQFKGRIAHGMLGASFISAVIGTSLPGPGAIYMSQNLKFRAPVRIGDVVVTRAEISEINLEKKRVTLRTICAVNGKAVIEGEALVMVPSRG
jgi:3-hydroxybutyryl-CoA dehydratase